MTHRTPGNGRFAAVLLTVLVLSMGCIHRTTSNQDLGLSDIIVSPKTRQKPPTPDESLRAVFRQQTQGAFDPFKDDQRVQMIQSRLKLDPQDAAARLELAGVYESYGFNDGALDQYTQAVGSAASAAFTEQAVLGIGRTARATRRIREVLPLLEGLLKASPSAGLWNQLGSMYDSLGELEAGEKAFREAVALDSRSDGFHNNLGYNLLLQKKVEAAEAEFRSALELNSKSATARNNLGVVLARRGDLAGALEQFQKVADAATAHNNLAVVLMENGQFEQSREQLVKALAFRRNFAPALANFKLVVERIRQQAAAGTSQPLVSENKDSKDQ
jgi:Tfp pilus assembly protein PilF